MKGLLFLMGVGAAIYAFLVITHDSLRGDTNDTLAFQTRLNQSVDQKVSSWDSYLPSRSASEASQLATLERPTAGDDVVQDSEQAGRADEQLAASEDTATTPEREGAKSELVERAKVVLAAQSHSQASVSSPTVHFYRPGTELQVVRREGIWFQVLDPVTQDPGWVLEQYLVSSDDRTPTQVAMASIPDSGPLAPTPAKPAIPKSKKHSRSAKHPVRGVVVASVDPWNDRWSRRAERRRGFGLFMFRPLGRFAQAR
jgi:hypothetical protein